MFLCACTPMHHAIQRLQAELMLRSIADARSAFGMSPEWCGKMEKASNTKKVLYVYRVIAGTDTAAKLHPVRVLCGVHVSHLKTRVLTSLMNA